MIIEALPKPVLNVKNSLCTTFNTLAVVTQWTPLGFKVRDPDSLDDISKERFEGTVLRAISRNLSKIKKEPREEGEGAEGGQTLLRQV